MTDKKESWARLAEYLSKPSRELPDYLYIPRGALVPDFEFSDGFTVGLTVARSGGETMVYVGSMLIPAEDLRAFAEWLLKAAG